MPKPKPCKGSSGRPGCGQAIVFVQAPAGGVIPLDPYPLPPGDEGSGRALRVDVVSYGLVLLGPNDASSSRTKLYERHRCVTARNAVPPPHKRTEQLGLEIDVRPANPGRW